MYLMLYCNQASNKLERPVTERICVLYHVSMTSRIDQLERNYNFHPKYFGTDIR